MVSGFSIFTCMVRLLALETSTAACSVALAQGDDINEQYVVAPQDHTSRLLPMIDELLSQHHLQLRDIDAIAFAGGPGSFTGLRICLGIVQGLAFGADLPVIKLSTLAVMANGASRLFECAEGTVIVPALDARMDEVYWGAYQVQQHGLRQLLPGAVNDPADLQHLLTALGLNGPTIGVGNGWICGPFASEQPTFVTKIISEFYPHAWDVAQLGLQQYQLKGGENVLEVAPTYIRNEVRWKKRQRIRT